MKRSRLILLICIISAMILMIPLGWAYYEYIGQYGMLLNINGTINQNAFGVLNGEDYRSSDDYPYGTTPENPFVIETIDHLYNLIRLNNGGRFDASKEKEGVDQYYFVLNFTEQPTPQVLDLAGAAVESVGNNDCLFIERLSGMVYAYPYKVEGVGKYIYVSGLIKPVEVTLEGATVYFDGEPTNVSAGAASPGEYVLIPKMYIDYEGADAIEAEGNMYVPLGSLIKVNNIVANATVRVPDDQVDVGFFSTIAVKTKPSGEGEEDPTEIRGGVRDLILYNITVECADTQDRGIFAALKEIWADIFGRHNFEEGYPSEDPDYPERHIGIFAGHIDGDAANITVAGEGKININSPGVNYYSRFTTVGYIDGGAMIGTKSFDALIKEGAAINAGLACMFADSIYAAAEGEGNSHVLDDIAKKDDWGGTSASDTGDLYFTYGSFAFILSENDDAVRKIWNNEDAVLMLKNNDYKAAKSVLYCNDEYRYSDTQKPGGSLTSSAASSNETIYQGAHSLVASGSLLDRGKYVIAARFPDAGVPGGYRYYALKIEAYVDAGGDVKHRFDTSEKRDITDYITGEDDTENIYSSAIWETLADSSSPVFRNMRFAAEYLTVAQKSGGGFEKALTEGSAVSFSYSVTDNTFYYSIEVEDEEDVYVTVHYYLNFDPTGEGFYFDTGRGTDIVIYRISNGFSLDQVTLAADLTANEDYVIVAKSGTDYYLLGEATEDEAGSTTVIATGTFAADMKYTGAMPPLWSLAEYQSYRQYVWYAAAVSGTGTRTVSFYDKLSGRYYLSTGGTDGDGGDSLVMSTAAADWTYTQAGQGGNLEREGYYLSYGAPDGDTGFTLGGVPYTVYIYKLNAEGDDAEYNTYQGARLITLESSTVQDGDYLIATDSGMGLVMSGSSEGTFDKLDISAYINGNGTSIMDNLKADTGNYAGYKWRVGSTSSAPSLRNVRNAGYYLSRNPGNSAPAVGEAAEWMYNATLGRLYYIVKTVNGDGTVTATTYYLAYNNGGPTPGFVITSEAGEPNYNYSILLYRLTFKHTYTGVQQVSSITANDIITSGNKKTYFLLTEPLTDMTTKATYALGARGTANESAVESKNISPNSTYSGTTLITYADLSYYSWYLDPRTPSGAADTSNPSRWNNIYNTLTTGGNSYFPGFQLKNAATGMYLAASSSPDTRTLVVATISNMNRSPASGSQMAEYNNEAMTAIGFGRRLGSTSDASRILHSADGTASLYVMGRSANYEYYIWKTKTPGVFELALHNQPPAAPNNYSRPYFYQASGVATEVTVAPMSERGDNLDAEMHYMIAAKVETGGQTQYYAISKVLDALGNKILSGINVTSQAVTINDSVLRNAGGDIIEEHSTDDLRMVPLESDWIQTSTDKGLRFYSNKDATNAEKDYLSVSGTAPGINRISTSSSEQPAEWYYDAVEKYFKYYDGDTAYYLKYEVSGNSFSLTTESSAATHFYIYRFKPTYVVTQVTDAGDESLRYGNFIVAGYSAGDYTALGVNSTDIISQNITKHISDNELTESEYLEILNYIWKQQYYDFVADLPGDYGPTNYYLQPFSQVTGAGFTVGNTTSFPSGFQTGSDPMSWQIVRNGSGLWSFTNSRRNGNIDITGSSRRTITFAGTSSRRLSITDYRFPGAVSFTNATTTLNLSADASAYSARLYALSNSNRTLTPITTETVVGSENRALVLSNGTNYYAVLIGTASSSASASRLTVASIDPTTGVISISTSTTFPANAVLSVAVSGYGYTLGRSNRVLVSNTNGSFTTPTSGGTAWLLRDGNYIEYPTGTARYLNMSGGNLQLGTTGQTETLLCYATPRSDGKYNITDAIPNGTPSAGKIVVLLYTGGNYYALRYTPGGAVAANLGGSIEALTDGIDADMVWTLRSGKFSYDYGGQTYYLRSNGTSLYYTVARAGGASWAFTPAFTAADNSNTTPLYIFKVELSSELDEVTDIDSLLKSKIELTPSVSLLESSRYIIVAEINKGTADEKYYSLGMTDPETTQALDITKILQSAAAGGTVTLFNSTVWEQRGSEVSLIFDNIGFGGSEPPYYLLTGALGNRSGMEPVVIEKEDMSGDLSDCKWRIYSYEDGSYLFGYTETSGDESVIYYLYFDTEALIFKLTSDFNRARGGGGVVQIYQLGRDTVEQPDFEKPIIETDESGVIISYPLNLAENDDDLRGYTPDMTAGANGDYLIIARSGRNYYALTQPGIGILSYVDVSPYFSGNYSIGYGFDDDGNPFTFPCLAINQKYIWRLTRSGDSLTFKEFVAERPLLGISSFTYDFETGTLSGGTGNLKFSVAEGFTYGAGDSEVKIQIYYLGRKEIDTGGEGGTLNYTYYTRPLSTSPGTGVDFSKFDFQKKHIGELINFAVGSSGRVEKSAGWNIKGAGLKLDTITTSVFFAGGIGYNETLADFADEFSKMKSKYGLTDPETGDRLPAETEYYAPAGTASFVVGEASRSSPVFVNVVVSTEFDAGLNADYLRYLALWRIAELVAPDGTEDIPTAIALKKYTSEGNTALDYAYTLLGKFNTPDFAIPLPNTHGSSVSGAADVYVSEDGEDPHYLGGAGYDEVLIAHTFVITEPGVYCLGSTYGSVALSYISIENMADGEEQSGFVSGSQFTVDFAYGDIDELTAGGIADTAGSSTRVGGDEWYHSNIFPMFVAGVKDKPAEQLEISVRRDKLTDKSSIVRVEAFTPGLEIAYMIRYANNNSLFQRQTRQVSFNVYCDGLVIEEFSTPPALWVATAGADGGFALSAVVNEQAPPLFLTAKMTEAEGVLSATAEYGWACVDDGYLRIAGIDGQYLTYDTETGTFGFADTSEHAVRVFEITGSVPERFLSDGGIYVLRLQTTESEMLCADPS